jgi:hypothetical protein
MRRTYLREHKTGVYTGLLLFVKLVAHLNEIDDAATQEWRLLWSK